MLNMCFYAPVKNEERYIKDFIEFHMKEMKLGDKFVFVDTGSTDKTKTIIKRLAKKHSNILFFDDYPKDHVFSFDFIRNYALSKVPSDIDVGIVLDIDEFFREGWRDKLESIFSRKKNIILTHRRYEDTSEESGQPGSYFIHRRCSIHSIHKMTKWVYPVHECLFSKDPNVEYIEDMSLTSIHLRNQQKERPSYHDLIEAYMKSKPKGYNRMQKLHLQYILANEYFSAKETDKAIDAFTTLLHDAVLIPSNVMSHRTRNNLTSAAVRLSSLYFNRKDRYKEGIYKHLAVSMVPCRETYIMLAVYYLSSPENSVQNRLLGEHYYHMGMSYTSQEDSYTVLPLFWDEEYLKEVASHFERKQ